MKTSAEYRAEGWKTLRQNAKEASLIMVAQVIVYFLYIAIRLIGNHFWPSEAVNDKLGMFFIEVLLLCTVGLIYYYVPVWFLLLKRQQPLFHTDVPTSYGKALLTSWAVMLPSIIWDAWSVLKAGGAEQTLGNHLLGVLLIMTALLIVWPFAVGITLPFRTYDHPDVSVDYLLKTNFQMMNGYKMKLFWVCFKVWFWPVVLYVLLALTILIVWIQSVNSDILEMGLPLGTLSENFELRYTTDYYPWKSHALGAVVAVLLLILGYGICQFVISPVAHFAHTAFYEDLLAERGGDVVDVTTPIIQAETQAETQEDEHDNENTIRIENIDNEQ